MTGGGSKKRANLATAEIPTGTCPDMCPERERYVREEQRRLSVYEMLPRNVSGIVESKFHRSLMKYEFVERCPLDVDSTKL